MPDNTKIDFSKLPLINLNKLDGPIARVHLGDLDLLVLPASGDAALQLEQVMHAYTITDAVERVAAVGKLNVMSVRQQIARESLRTLDNQQLSEAQIGKLNIRQLNTVMALATEQQDSVRELIETHEKNVDGPAAT